MTPKNAYLMRTLLSLFLLALTLCSPMFCQSAATTALPKSVTDLQPVLQDDRILKAPPQVEVKADGTAILAFETMVATPPVRIFIGQLNPDASLETPFFRFEAKESPQEPVTSHRISFDFKRLEKAAQSVPDSPAHEGDVNYRLEIFDPRTSATKYFESRFHYFAQRGRYEKRTTILYGPFVDQATTNSAIIFWTTDRPSRGVVELYSADGKTLIKSFLGDPIVATDRKIKMTGLAAGRSYRYHVVVFDEKGDKPVNTSSMYRFQAAPLKGQKFQFAFLSDGRPSLGGGFSNFNGVNAAVTQQLLADGYRRGANLILFGGDLSAGYTSSVENFDMMFDTWKSISEPVGHLIPIYEGFGNHESLHDFYRDAAGNRYSRDKTGDVSSESVFARHFANPDEDFPAPEVQNGVTGPSYRGTAYSFDYSNAHFIMLNMDYWYTTGGPRGDPALAYQLLGGNRNGYIMKNQMKWLAKDLAAARKRGVEHIFICGHDMAFPTGGHADDAMWWNGLNDPSIPSGDVVAMRERFMKLVNDYQVTALLFGHEHNYSRTVIDHSVDKAMQHPVTQIISGGAGAPFYPQDTEVPWRSAVKKHAMTYHYVLFKVDGPKVKFSVIDLEGQVIDSAILR